MEKSNNQKPCAVQKIETPQGFSVSYNEHLLYSKYNPSKNIITTVEKLELLPGTIILSCSPLLGYGLSELCQKLPENCIIILCEADRALYDFSIEEKSISLKDDRILDCLPEELSDLPVKLFNITRANFYKRVIRLDMSAGIQFHKDYYDNLFRACQNAVMTFWKNRLTLTKFGHRYSKHLFENLHTLGNSRPISDFYKAVEKPILVFGAGESTQSFIDKNKINPKDYFILCVDTALQPLLKNHIKADGVFIEEAQSIITKAFIGLPEDVHIFAGLSSIPNIAHAFGEQQLSYFFTEYTKASFIEDLKTKDFTPPVNLPFGSVGLTAVYYALKFRKNEEIPVYVTGLDFSYSIGCTHTRGALAHILRLINSNRLNSPANYSAAFGLGAEKLSDKKGNLFITTPTLSNYAAMFNSFFGKEKNLFDAGESGLSLAIPQAIPKPSDKKLLHLKESKFSDTQKYEIQNFLNEERTALENLKDLLTGKTKLEGEALLSEITRLAEPREYLYLHFADGYKFTTSQSFLNRIRTEIDFFLKYL